MSRHKKWIYVCLKHAVKSSVGKYKHGSILVKGGRIINIGINKNKRGVLGHECYDQHKGWHSELDVLHAVDPSEARGAVLYVAGISKGGNVVFSAPCKCCQEYLSQFNLKAIYYSTPNLEVERLVI